MPSLPTNAEFIAAIQAMTVTGVDRHYDYPPPSVDISAGECAFPVMPGADQSQYVSTCINMSKARTVPYVIIVDGAGQGTQEQNYAKLAPLMDNLETALDALTVGNFITYEITTDGNYPVGNSEYLAIIASVQVTET